MIDFLIFYCFALDGVIKYVGRCTDNFKKRINDGYGKIHPKNCFIDGQATNCRINGLVNASDRLTFGVYIMDGSKEEIIALEKAVLLQGRFDLNIQKR